MKTHIIKFGDGCTLIVTLIDRNGGVIRPSVLKTLAVGLTKGATTVSNIGFTLNTNSTITIALTRAAHLTAVGTYNLILEGTLADGQEFTNNDQIIEVKSLQVSNPTTFTTSIILRQVHAVDETNYPLGFDGLGFEPFDATKPYSKLDVAIFNGRLHQFTEDHPAGIWDETQVEETDIQALLSKSGGAAAKLAVSITYAALKALREGGNLVPGTWYRITDYHTTVSSLVEHTRSADHQFDVIVRADDASHLNENAFAAHHEGDEYFANCKLEAWELKYCIDNDNTRFAWADEDGKGTIYFMKDENGNQAPYDFKNIQFKRWLVTDSMSGRTGFADQYLGVLNYLPNKLSIEDEDDFVWAYTFSSNSAGGEQEDYSMDGKANYVYGNIIEESKNYFGNRVLPNNVFFGRYCFSNHLMMDCYSNSFSQGCSQNSFSQSCSQNSFSQNCCQNSFSHNCCQNSFSQNCFQNSFSQNCTNNSFSRYCQNNSFSQECYDNSFSQYCQNNSFSEGCSQNSFSQSCYNIHLFSGVRYCDVSGTGTGTLINAQILSGMVGTSNSHLSVVIAEDKAYTQMVGKNTSGEVKVWNPADFVQ